jgi:hypothetical protein
MALVARHRAISQARNSASSIVSSSNPEDHMMLLGLQIYFMLWPQQHIAATQSMWWWGGGMHRKIHKPATAVVKASKEKLPHHNHKHQQVSESW